MTDQAADYIFVNNHQVDFAIPGNLGIVQTHKTWLENKEKPRHFPFLNISEYLGKMEKSIKLNFIHTYLSDLNEDLISSLKTDKTAVLLLDTFNHHGMAEQRRLFVELMNAECNTPVIIGRTFRNLTVDQLQLQSATDMGALFIDGLGDGVFIASENCGPEQMINQTAFGILQATRTRISKTEYISCPSCGRTLFDLQEVTAKIRARTEHLKGIKIGIMGCIVNGPGEMADADYGYVGTGPGKI